MCRQMVVSGDNLLFLSLFDTFLEFCCALEHGMLCDILEKALIRVCSLLRAIKSGSKFLKMK